MAMLDRLGLGGPGPRAERFATPSLVRLIGESPRGVVGVAEAESRTGVSRRA